MRRIPLAAIGVTIALVSGCSGGSSSSAGSASSEGTAASSAPSAEEKAADLRQATAMVPQLSDFPTGWSRDVDPSSSNDKSCKIDKAGLVMTSEVGKDHPVTFTQSDTTQVFAIAATWHTEAQTSTAYHRTVDPKRIACFAGTFREGARIGADQSTTVGKVTVSEVSFPTIGDESKVYRIALPLESSGATFTIYVDYIVFRVQRGIGVLATFNLGRPFDPRFAAHLAAKLADRGAQTAPAVV